MVQRPERFEPGNGKELRKAIKKAFVNEHELVIADVVYERAPIAPDGEVGIIAQTRSPVSLYHDYSPLPPFQEAFTVGELDQVVSAAKNRLLDQVAIDQEGRTYESDEEWAKEYLQSMFDKDGRTSTGSLLIKDPDAHRKKFAAREKLDDPMRAEEYLRQRGWIRMFHLEVYEEARRLIKEEDKSPHQLRDHGIRYTIGNTGFASTSNDALGMQLHMDALNVGGFEVYMDLIEKHRVDQ